MNHPLNTLTGMALEGKYSLEKCVAAEGEAAFFTTFFGPARQPALLKLIPEGAPSAGRQLDILRQGNGLSRNYQVGRR